jgi:hypothetical protein
MISKTFYIEDRLVKQFFNKTLKHFPQKIRIKVLETKPYEVVYGDTLYSIASKHFGEGLEQYWTIISDVNQCRKPLDLYIGEVIRLPLVIIEELPTRLPLYEQNTAPATAI